MRRAVLAGVALLSALSLTGCSYQGINSFVLPGDEGTGDSSYQITVQLAEADNLVANVPVMVNDVNVGTVTKVALVDWKPTLTVSLGHDVRLPANVVARLGQTSLLGSKHLELADPPGVAPEGTLRAGAVVPESRSSGYPETEDVLASVSMLLNGGGLQNFQVIVSELNKTLGGRTGDVRDLLTQLNTFTGGLDQQKGDIISALHGLDRLGGTLAPKTGVIESALQTLPDGLSTLSDEEPALVHTMDALGRAGDAFGPFSDDGLHPLRQVIGDVAPALRQTADTQASLITSLKLLPFVIFPLETVSHEFRGDAVNLAVTLNLTNESLDKGFLGGTPAVGALSQADKLLHSPALQATNPLLLPLDDARVPGAPARPGTHPGAKDSGSGSGRRGGAAADDHPGGHSGGLLPPVVPKLGG